MTRFAARTAAPLTVVLAAVLTLVLPFPARPASADVTTGAVDNLRTGWDSDEAGLTPAQVSSSDFGQQFSTAVDGQVYAQPLVYGGLVIVATENNKVYGINGATGTIVWSKSLGPAWPAAAIGCGNLEPTVGVTATPVIDPATGTVYLTAKVNDGPDTSHPHWYAHALDAMSGAERVGWPLTIAGAPTNDLTRPFNAFTAMQRPGLLFLDGWVYAAFASHCDVQPYDGYVLGINASDRAMTMWATEDNTSSGRGGIWGPGAGLISDGPGRIIFTSGNGISPAPGPGHNPPGQLAESVVRLGVNADGTLSAQDFFAPVNANTLDLNDQDLGSGAPLALPSPAFGTPTHPHLLVQIGKDGRVFLLDRDNLGGRGQGSGGTDAALQVGGPFEGVWGHPVAFGGGGGYVYTVGSRAPLRALAYGVNGAGSPTLTSVATSPETFGYSSGSPIVTSVGDDPSSALVWVEYSDGNNGTNGQLRAYDAIPVNGVMRLRWSAPIGIAAKFPVPATDGGRIYVGTRDGHVLAFGRPASAALTGSPVDFGQVPVNTSQQKIATVTAHRTLTVTGVSTPAGSRFTAQPPPLPRTMNAGDTMDVPVTFAPTRAGPATAVLTFTMDIGTSGLDLSGYATQPGLQASPPTLAFGQVPTSTTETLGVTFTNTGTDPEIVSATHAPNAPYSASGLPAAGFSIAPQQTVTVQVTYAPTAASSGDTDTLSITGQNGTTSVPLSGSAIVGQAVLTVNPTSTDFGNTRVGQARTRTFDVSNTGNIPLTITKAGVPSPPFFVSNPIPEGQILNPGDVLHENVTFVPSATGPATGVYQITGDDGRGPQNETLTGNGTTPAAGVTVGAPGYGGWQLNGTTRLAGNDLNLTQTTEGQTGSAVFPVPVLTDGLVANFTAIIGGGTGADGATFALLDPAKVTPAALGVGGGALGFGGLPGVALGIDTYPNAGDPSDNFIGLATTMKSDGGLAWLQTSTQINTIRRNTHKFTVQVVGKTITVAMDGTQKLSLSVASLPPAAFVAFTGANGALTDIHTIRDANITATAYALPPPGVNGWTFNGTAKLSGTDLVLTPAAKGVKGSAFQSTVIPPTRLKAHFVAQISGGGTIGADGMTLALLDSSKAGVTSLGGGGGGLGFQGLPGVAITLDTYRNSWDPATSLVTVATTGSSGHLAYAATASVPNLRSGTHTVDVAYASGQLTVAVDGRQVINVAITLPAGIIAGFTGATGGYFDVHTVRSVTISY
ncbi:MAG: choice-of-anchor D domain-containing protein [Hamadaea sp.]|uniref:choice-of-anchor D domain-containing protein n=1 Tax=Hamadaea sp. TaxID=2024425 RepID=UPI0017972CD3|nr:choice-of-anchor D domain-containing protein [Hamadaea sp.]NUT20972.1 choice-of-anchor D domain-containing protein [Hamadaea sp.]